MAKIRLAAPSERSGGYGMNDPSWRRASVKGNVSNAEPFSGHASVYRCVTVLTNALISAPLVEVKGPKRNPKIVEEGGSYTDLLDDPNPHQTQRQFVEAFGTYFLLDGEVGIYCEGANGPAKAGEIPLEMWPLPKSALEPVVDEGSKMLLGWKVATSNGQIEVPSHSLIHLRFFNPQDPLRGLSPLSAAATGLRSDQKAEAWGEAFFDNGAEPGGVLSTDGALSPRQRTEMREAWEEKHRGASRAHRVAVLEGGLSYQAIGIPQKDMQFLEQRAWNETQIAKVYGVPKFFLMDATDISYASTRQNKVALWELAALPLIEKIEDVFRVRLCGPRTGRNHRIAFDLTQVAALREVIDGVVGSAEGLVRLGYPLNEVNERLGLGMPAQPWGDEGTLPMGVAPAAQVVEGTAGADVGLEDFDEEDDDDPEDPDATPQEDKPKESEPIRGCSIHGERALDEQAQRRADLWDAIERSTNGPIAAKFEKRLKGFFRGRLAEVLRMLDGLGKGRAGEAKTIRQFLLEADVRWAAQIAKQTRPIYRQAVLAAIQGLAQELGGVATFNAANPAVARMIAQRESLVRGVPKSILKSLKRVLLESSAAKDDVGDLQARVKALSKKARSVFKASNARALAIARSETSAITNAVRTKAMQVEGVERVEWLTAKDAFVRDEDLSPRKRPKANHRDLDGKIVEVGESFVSGITLRHPGDPQAPAQWAVNCRCTVAPVRSK